MTETKTTFCRICESLCGLEVDVDGDRVVDIRPDKDHIISSGFACLKGLKQHHIYQSKDRVTQPMKRIGDKWVPISWEQANQEIGEKVKSIRERFSRHSVGMYVGTAAGFGVLHPMFAQGFMQGMGSRSMFASSTQDCANKFAVSNQLYGFPFTLTWPDIDETECLIIVGANPVVSKWSFLQVSNPSRRLKDIQKRGAKLYVVDPRRTETAKVAGEYVAIRPNTDVFFYLAFLNELIAQGGVDQQRIEEFTTGFDEIETLAKQWTPERAEQVTRIPAETMRKMVRDYANADGAALYCSTGVNMGTHGTLAFWLQEVINAVSGNLDKRGGTMVGKGKLDLPAFGKKNGLLMNASHSRVGDFEATNDIMPGPILADEILTPGEEQIRGMFITGGNPLITMANSERLREAFKDLELLVCIDLFITETASVGHYVLPATSPLERPDLPFLFPLMLGIQSKSYLQATKPMIPPIGDVRDEGTIYVDLAKACGTPLFGSKIAQKSMELAAGVQTLRAGRRELPQEAILSLLLRVAKAGSFKDMVKNHPHGQRFEDTSPGTFLGSRILTDDGRVHLAPENLMERTSTLASFFEQELGDADTLKLITKRAITTHNSWTHNYEGFMHDRNRTNHLYMHPADAERLGLDDGDIVDVESKVSTVRLPLELLEDLTLGTVALPHGWGHQHADGLSVASATDGVNVNLLAGDGVDGADRVSGMAHLTGFNVQVRAATGPRDTTSWSGIAPG